jgi:protease-4
MMPQPPPGQGPVDPRGAFSPPPAPGAGAPTPPPGYMPPMPPMMMMPPPYYPPPPRGRNFAGAIFTTLATTVLGLSLLMNVIFLFSSASNADHIKEETVVDGSSSEVIAVIPIHGIIDDRMVERFEKMISQAEKNSSVKAIVLDIDSPGGAVTAADEIYQRVHALKEKKHIVASIGGLGASGGYYIACGAEYVFAEKTSLTGSIGVIMPNFNIHKLTESYGIEETTITSDGATYKNAGSMFQVEKPEDRKYFQAIINQAFDGFKGIVKDNRKLKGNIDDIANGKIYTADEALGFGLIDKIGYPQEAWDKAAQLAGVSNKQVVKYEPQTSWLSAFGESKFGGASPQSSVQINGINVNIDRNAISELLTPRPMYLWRGQ